MAEILYHPESDSYFVGTASGPDYDQGLHDVDPCDLPAGTEIQTTVYSSTVLPSMDFETYSEAGYVLDVPARKVRSANPSKGGKSGLPLVGTPVYMEHPSAEILSLAYDLKDGRGRRLWVPGAPAPLDLLEYIAGGGLIEAWNVTFEFWAWNMLGVRKHGWPVLRLAQCRCAMAKARRYSLPGSLALAAQVLRTTEKLADGKDLIRKLTRPHTPTKDRPGWRRTPATNWDDFALFYQYNLQDVEAEDHASARIPDLTPSELATWQLDQTINARGVQVDIETLDAALDILAQCERKYTMRLAEITGGAVGSVSEVAKFGDWLTSIGCPLADLTADTVDEALKRTDLSDAAREALTIRANLGAANVKKLRTLKLQVSSDGRLRDQYKYCGADRTGRAAAGGVQLQNITAKGPSSMRCNCCGLTYGRATDAIGCPRCGNWVDLEEVEEWTIEGVEHAIADIRTRSLEHVERMWGDAIAVLCGCLRGLFIAGPGKKLVCVDFSAIEAVVAACLSRCQWRIDVFSTPGECIYTRSASKITGTPIEVYKDYKAQNGGHHPDRKKIGKIAELACFGPRTQVLTRRGYVNIAEVESTDELWDGIEWVKHQGVVAKGRREVLRLDGVTVTPEHPVSLNGSWLEAKRLASSPSTLRRALATGSANLPSCATSVEGKSAALSSGVVVAVARTFARCLISTKARRPGAPSADGRKANRPTSRGTANTPTSFPTVSTVGGWSTVCERLLRAATHRPTSNTQTTAVGVLRSAMSGAARTAQRISSSTLSLWTAGIARSLKWAGETLMATTSRETCALSLAARICTTSGRSEKCKSESTNWSDIYDIVNAGPRHRFTIKTDSGHLLVHNSGYGGWVGAWKNFGCDMPDSEIKEQVLAWRAASPEIEHMWGGQFLWCGPGKWDYRPELFGLEGMAIKAIQNPGQCFSYLDITYGVRDDVLFCRLPSGRFLYYHRPRLHQVADKLNRGPSWQITFEGYNSNSQKGPIGWQRMETYGGRLFENVVQAVAADIQFDALKRCEAAGYSIVMHTHDEGCAEVPNDPSYTVDGMAAIMIERPPWAAWWPIKAAGWEHQRYQKD